MEEENNDFLKLSVEDRCQHKAWKARVSGYEEVTNLFEIQDDEKSPEFLKYLGLLKKFVLDSNAIAQEKGLAAVLAFVKNAACAPRAVNDVMSGLVSKCFSSPRAKTRELAFEIVLMYIEIEKQDVVSEELIKGLENKSPKVVSACIVTLRQSLNLFGSQVILLKPIVKVLPKLLEDRDKSVREESKHLCVEIYRWVGEAIRPQLAAFKPVTLSELEKEFQKIAGERITPTRYLKSQQEKIAKQKQNEVEGDMDNSEEALAPPPQVDAFDLMTAVDVLSKLPPNFYEQCEAKKWQERKEVLDGLIQLTTNVKLESGDYGDLVRALKKSITKDSNVVVVALAIKCLTNLILGLRKKFQPYASACIPAIFEKFKEKKQNVVVALRECIDALYSISTFDVMLEDIKAALENKNPQVKAETCAFLTRAFSVCPTAQLNKKLLKSFTALLLKTLNDTDASVRENSAAAIGTALKVVGEQVMTPFLKEVDAIKMAKIKDFCDNAVVSNQQAVAEKKPVSVPAKPVPIKNEEPVPKPVLGGIKKPASAGPAKSKAGSAAARSVRPGTAKKATVDAGEPEFKEQDLSEEDVITQATELLTEDVVNGLGSSNWKDRLVAAEKFFEIIRALEKGTLPAQCLIKLLAKKPGFKDNNFQILKLRFEMLAYIADNAQVSHITVEHCLSDIVDKVGDAKNGAHAGLALTALAGATTLEYVSLEVLNLAFNQKNPKNLSETLIWLSTAIKQFGLKIKVKEVIDSLKKGFSSTNPGVRNASLAVVGTMYMYVGKSLRTFFEDEKPALLQQIDAEFEKMKDAKPPAPEKGKAGRVDGSGDAPENTGGQINIADLMPRVDISPQITSQILSDLSDKDWHLRSDALQKISVIIGEAKFLTPNLGELPIALKPRLADTNKRLALQALSICQMLGASLGAHCSKQIRNFAPGILSCLGDNKANVRVAAIQCLNSWMDNCPLVNLFEGEMLADVLKTDNPFLRIELYGWLTEKMPTVTSLPANDLIVCLPVLLTCLEDRNPEVRKKASECLLPFMMHVGYEPMARAASKLKPASKTTVMAQLEKVRQTLPPKPNAAAKTKQAKGFTSSSNENRSSPPQAAANEEGVKGKLNRSTSKSKLALKAPSAGVAKGKKEEEIDTSPSLVANNMKDQRMADEKALKVLKWNFTNPREEFYIQLKDQMAAANWSQTLISHCFHNDFKFHIKAIDLLIESLKSGVEASAANFDLIVKWLALRFFDTNPSVLIKSLEYLQALLLALMDINYRMLEPEASSFVPYLILKIGDPKDGVRKGVREIIKSISRIYPYSKMFSYIMQGLTSKNARQRAECLEELGYMIETYGLNVCQPSPQVALKEVAKQISDRDNSVRNAALNCVVQAYYIEGEKVYKIVGKLGDKELSLLEERIKRIPKTRTVKPVEEPRSNLSLVKASPPGPVHSAYAAVEEETKIVPLATPPRRSGPLKLETDDIEQMFRRKEPEVQLPGLVQVNADEILNLPDIQLPRTRMRPPAASLKILNSTDDVDMCVNIVMSQLAAQDIPVVIQAFAQIEEVLKKSEQALAVLSSRVDQLLVMGAMQYRYAHNKHMADETICKADVVSLYRCVTLALVALFDNPVLSKKASRDVLRDLVPHLITVMLDNRLDDLQEGAHVVKIINVLIMRILQKGNPTHVLSALIKLLYDCVGSVNVSDRFTDLVMKCLWKMIRMIRQFIHEMNIDRILLDIHVFLKTFPSSSWKERADDTPIRTIKTILFKLVEIKNEDIMKHLSLISDRQESDLVNYLHKLLSKRKDDNRTSSNKNPAGIDNDGNIRHKRCKSSPLKLSKSTHEALTEIFRKIGCKEQTKEGLAELYEFTQNHPEADIEPYLKNSSDFFQNYIRQGIQQLKEKGLVNSNRASPLVTSKRSEESTGWNSNLAGKDVSFTKDKVSSQAWEEKFPPVPPCTIDTTPMDLVEWLKNVVARLGMDTSKYDDPSFLDKITGNGNNGPLSEEEMSTMFSDIERYRKIIDDLRNAA